MSIGARKPYFRSMTGWWNRNAFFRNYMLRELTAFLVLAYAIVLTVGLVRFSQGPQAWEQFLAAVTSPFGRLFHGVLLISFFIHAKSWFEIMPKTMPMIFVGGKRLAARTITLAGWAASVATTLLVLIILRVLA